jgi:hypothetical protein
MNLLINGNAVMIFYGYRMMSSSALVDQSRLNCCVVLIYWNLLELLDFGEMMM